MELLGFNELYRCKEDDGTITVRKMGVPTFPGNVWLIMLLPMLIFYMR